MAQASTPARRGLLNKLNCASLDLRMPYDSLQPGAKSVMRIPSWESRGTCSLTGSVGRLDPAKSGMLKECPSEWGPWGPQAPALAGRRPARP
jgi:hypothetical protein